MGFLKLPFSFEQLKKDPFVALTFLFLSYIVWDVFINKNDSLEYCKEENVRLRKERNTALVEKDNLYKAMLYYRGITIVQDIELKSLDSIINAKIGVTARKIVK